MVAYVVFSVYFYADDTETFNGLSNNTGSPETQEYSGINSVNQTLSTSNNQLHSQCDTFPTALQLVYPNTEAFSQAHLNLIEQWILKNSDLSVPVRDKVATSIGLQYAHTNTTFNRHVRMPANIDFSAQMPVTEMSTKAVMNLFYAGPNRSLNEIADEVRPLIAAAVDNRLSVQIENRKRTLLWGFLRRNEERDNAKYINAFLAAGYKVKLSEITDLIVSPFTSDNGITQAILNAHTDNLNYRFTTPDSPSTVTLVLYSLMNGKAELANYFLSQGVEFNTDIELQRALTEKLPYFPENNNTNVALENLLDAGVFLFSPQTITNTNLLPDLPQVESNFAYDDQIRELPPDLGTDLVLESLTERFGENKAKSLMASHIKDDLLTEDEREKAQLVLSTFISAATNLLPASLKTQVKECGINYAEALVLLSQQHYKQKLNSLYKRLVTHSEEINVIRGERYVELTPEKLDALMNNGTYAAKEALEDHLQLLRRNRIIDREAQFDSGEFFAELDTIVNNQGIDAMLKFIQDYEGIPSDVKQTFLFSIQLRLNQDFSNIQSLVSNDNEINYFRMVDLITADRSNDLSEFAKNNANLNYQEESGHNLLWHAVDHSAKSSFDFLLTNNVPIQAPNVIGFDALDIALNKVRMRNADFYFVDKLLSNGHQIKASHVELLRDLAKNHYDKIAAIFEQYDIPLD